MAEKKGIFSFLNFDSIVDNLSGYVEKRIALFKIEIKEDLALGSARIVIALVLSLAIFMIILFSSLAIGVYFNNLLNSAVWGFLIVAGFYLLLFALFFLLKDPLKLEEKLKSIFLEMFNNLGKDGDQ